jgi:hypothetical protein
VRAKVYVAGPYSVGEALTNVHNAIAVAERLADLGFAPFVPHLNHFWHVISPRTYEFWMGLDLEFLPVCDVLLRLPGESLGADREMERAVMLGIPVFHSVEWVDRYFKGKGK